ncbi:hypothetical protein [Peterkaempfera sp. SMS 1(5)a]|uniref:hypothetical protein n=1 Tax=Peterkaempfera podocarpi TaxID=3232308 RepID=UPI00366ACDE7
MVLGVDTGRRAAVLLLAGVAVAAPGAASGASPPDRSYQASGDRLAGTESSSDAPVMTAGRSYTDTLALGDRKYWAVDLDGASAAYVSVTLAPRSGGKASYGDGAELKLESTGGDRCGGGTLSIASSDQSAMPVTGTASRVPRQDHSGSCDKAGRYLVSLERTSKAGSDPASWPVELQFLLEPALRPGSTPGVARTAAPATPVPQPGEPRPVAGSHGFAGAPALGAGVWKDSLHPGEQLYYRVPLHWGQSLSSRIEIANATTKGSGSYASTQIEQTLLNPARTPGESQSAYYSGDPAESSLLTVPVAYANRWESGDDTTAMALEGWYYLAVSMAPGGAKVVGADGSVGITIRLRTQGAAVAGPGYAGDAMKAGFGIGDPAQIGTGQPLQVSGGASGRTVLAVVALGTGTLLLLSLLGWSAAARRRTA